MCCRKSKERLDLDRTGAGPETKQPHLRIGRKLDIIRFTKSMLQLREYDEDIGRSDLWLLQRKVDSLNATKKVDLGTPRGAAMNCKSPAGIRI
ncbi:hypothetical protein LguiB_035908 [Lonicera macranthoides]